MSRPRRHTTPPRATPPRAEEILAGEASGERGVVLASRLCGERALPVVGRLVLLSPGRLCRHVLVCGATGSGKTETLLRLAWTVAKTGSAQVFYLDGKGDHETAARFCALMADAGRPTRVFPGEPLDGWRGRAHEIRGRLMEIVDYAHEGPATWYRDLAKAVLGLVCEHPQGPPRSSAEALRRMDLDALRQAHPASTAALALTAAQVRQVRLRYEAFFGEARGALDGRWAWEDASAGYLLLDSLALREATASLARFLFEDFAHYFTIRKPRARLCVLIVDEFSALAGVGMASRVEQARGFNTALVLAPQVLAGMGGEVEAARILGSVETVICHRVNTPEEIVSLAGTRQVIEYSTRLSPHGPTREGSARLEERPKIDPNQVRCLRPGAAFLISRGRAMKAQILTAPALSHLPPPPPAAPPPEPPPTAGAAAEGSSPPTVHGRAPEVAERGVPFGESQPEKGVGDLPF